MMYFKEHLKVLSILNFNIQKIKKLFFVNFLITVNPRIEKPSESEFPCFNKKLSLIL